MKEKYYVCGKKIKQNTDLVALLHECEADFETVSTFEVVPMRYFDEFQKKECYREDYVPMTIFEHAVGIPLIPKDLSHFGKPENPKISDYVGYFIAPIKSNKNKNFLCNGWALYEVMWREFVDSERG